MLWSGRVIVIPPTGPDTSPPVGPAGSGPRLLPDASPGCPFAPTRATFMRRAVAVLTATLLAASLGLRAADPPAPAPAADQDLQKIKQQAAYEQEKLRRQFGA